jgi:uncharacterized protein YjbJ (UPF0337 family)
MMSSVPSTSALVRLAQSRTQCRGSVQSRDAARAEWSSAAFCARPQQKVCILELSPISRVINRSSIIKKERIMDREHVKGAAEKAKGAIKDTAGKITGDKELQTEGKLDKAKGEAHNIAGDMKDAVRKAGK